MGSTAGTTGAGPARVSHRRAVGALVALAIGAFSFVTAELLPIGLLTVISADLDRSPFQTGLLVTGYAGVVVLASLPLTALTRRVPRRLLLSGTLAVFTVATVLSALADTYAVLLGARLLTATAQALFWSVVAPTATGLFPPEVRGRVVSRFTIGAALAPVLGVPAGTWIGQQAGWRAAFLAMACLSLATCVVVTALVPSYRPEDGGAARGSAPDRRRYLVLLLVTGLGVTAFMTAYTYITPYLLEVGGFPPAALAPLLLVSGVAGVAGTYAVGRVLDRRPFGALLATIVLLAAALTGLYALGHLRPPSVVLLAAAGMAYAAMATSITHRTLQVAPGPTDLASAGTGTAFNAGIAAGSFVGGALVDGPGVRSVALAGGVLAAAALALLLAEPRLARGAAPAHTPATSP